MPLFNNPAWRKMVVLSFAVWLCALTPAVSHAQDDGSDQSSDSDDDTLAEKSIDHTPTYNLYDDVDMVSALKFQYLKPRIVVKTVYPQLASDTDNDGVSHFNDLVSQLIQTDISNFQNSLKMHTPSQKTATKTKTSNNLYIDYDTSFLKTGKSHIISVRFTAQGYMTNASQPYNYHHVINYNVDTGQEIQLGDLFNADSNYLQTISGYCFQVLSQRLKGSKDLVSSGTAPTAENYANWNIKANGLLITFDTYKVAPAIQGFQTVLVPYSFLENIISPDAPMASCVKHKRRCASNSLLTGGFIDEAEAKQVQDNKDLA